MNSQYVSFLKDQLKTIKEQGLYKSERYIESPQQSKIVSDHVTCLNFCANNYLGLANHPYLIEQAKKALDEFGYGMASVRFICGTSVLHKELERKMSEFLQKEDTILYSSCFDANTGLFETLLSAEDSIFSAALNHASIIDGVRLCKAKRYRFSNEDLEGLDQQLKEDTCSRFKLICTDGVFSMDGFYADLEALSSLAKKYNAILMVDDSHAVGFVGEKGRGTGELFGVQDKVDILTGTFGKALGGASGGYVSGPKEVIDYLRQKSRPYLFSNSLAPSIVASSLAALELVEKHPELRERLKQNTKYFRRSLEEAGFDLIKGSHPIVPIMVRDDKMANLFAQELLKQGVYVISFSFPVVPRGASRIRIQLSAAHTKEELDHAVNSFIKVGQRLSII